MAILYEVGVGHLVAETLSSLRYDVLIVCCNGEQYLDQQLESILGQNLPPELILASDDASTDRTWSILQEWQKRTDGKSIVLRRQRKRLGIRAHVNNALHVLRAIGSSPYLFLADQDDIWDLDKVERSLAVIEAMEKQSGPQTPLLVHTDLRLIAANGRPLSPSYASSVRLDKSRVSIHELAFQNVVTGCTAVINRSCLDAALPIPEEALMHDHWLALVASGLGEIAYLPQQTLCYRQHASNLVGANPFSRKHLFGWLSIVSSGLAAERLVAPAVLQAMVFTARYGHRYKHISAALPLIHLKGLLSCKLADRVQAALALRINKHGIRRTIAFWICILLPRQRSTRPACMRE